MVFTNILDTDNEILLKIDDISLLVMYQVNKKMKHMIINHPVLYRKFIYFKMIYGKISKSINQCSDNGHVQVCFRNSGHLTINTIQHKILFAKKIQYSSTNAILYTVSASKTLESIKMIVKVLGQTFNIERVCKNRFVDRIEY